MQSLLYQRPERGHQAKRLGLLWAMIDTNEVLSGISGSVSLTCWIFVLIPQLLENYMSQSADGISLAFLLVWLVTFPEQLLSDSYHILIFKTCRRSRTLRRPVSGLSPHPQRHMLTRKSLKVHRWCCQSAWSKSCPFGAHRNCMVFQSSCFHLIEKTNYQDAKHATAVILCQPPIQLPKLSL